MKAWLSGEHQYVKIQLMPKLQGQLQGGNPAVMKLLCHQVAQTLGGAPISWKWELNGDTVDIGAAL